MSSLRTEVKLKASHRFAILMAATVAFSAAGSASFAQSKMINLYTHREPGLIKPLLEKFTLETGISVNVVFAANGLAERMQSEGAAGPADMLLTVDIATIAHAVELGIAAPVDSTILKAAIPQGMRAQDGAWHAVSARARVIYASKERVKETSLTYEKLADPAFKGRFCTRSGKHSYNIGLISEAIGVLGADKAEAWLKGLKANLAKRPSGGDRDVAKDIAAGLCDIGLGNTYYIGLMARDNAQKAWVEAINVIVPTFEQGGTHLNVSGLIVSKWAKNRAEAIQLAEWLAGKSAQSHYAALNFEYPVIEGADIAPAISSFGPVRPGWISLESIAKNRKLASELVEKTGFDQGP